MLWCRRHLDKAGTLLLRNTAVLSNSRREMLAGACSKPPTLVTCSDSVWNFISFNAEYLRCKGACHDSQTDPLDAPLA